MKETWESYVVQVIVDVEDITPEQYNQLCDAVAAAADAALPGVDVVVSGHVETFSDADSGPVPRP
jgi:hypothetical protein